MPRSRPPVPAAESPPCAPCATGGHLFRLTDAACAAARDLTGLAMPVRSRSTTSVWLHVGRRRRTLHRTARPRALRDSSWSFADAAAGTAATRDALVGCPPHHLRARWTPSRRPGPGRGAAEGGRPTCSVGPETSATKAEVEQALQLWDTVSQDASETLAVQAILASAMLSPHLFRVEQ